MASKPFGEWKSSAVRGAWALAAALVLVLSAGALGVHAQTQVEGAASQTAPLRVVTKEIEPFVFVGDELSGFSIDLWQELARTAGLSYEFTTVEAVTDQLDAVAAGEADVAIAAISITQEREETVDFSFSYFDAGLGILTSRTHASAPPIRAIMSPRFLVRVLQLFGLLLLVIIVAAHVIWMLERNRNEDFPRGYLAGVWQGIWWAAVTVTTVGYGDKTPRGPVGRMFGLLWMFAGLFIIANFTAGVTSQLTVQHIQGVINGPEDLPGKTIVTVEGSTADEWLTQRRIPHGTVVAVDEAYEMLESGSVHAVVYDYPVLRYHALNFGQGRVVVVGSPFNEEDYGIVVAEGSPQREEINRALLRLREDGTYDRIYATWFGN